MPESSYPIVVEHRLPPAHRGWLGRSRPSTDLPQTPPGTVLVLHTAAGWLAQTESRHLSGKEDAVVQAVAASVVDVRPRQITVPISLHSSDPGESFLVRADFRCRVDRPDLVAAAGPNDLDTTLRSFLCQDTALIQIAADRRTAEIARVRTEVSNRIRAYCALSTPRVDGMTIALTTVDVVPPNDLIDYHQAMTRQERSHNVEDVAIRRIADYLREDPRVQEAYAIARGERNSGQSAEERYTRELQHRQTMLQVLKSLPNELLDTTAVDVDRILQAVMGEVFAPGGPAVLDTANPVAALEHGSPWSQPDDHTH